MSLHRRDVLESAVGAAVMTVLGCRGSSEYSLTAPPPSLKLPVGGCDWSLKQEGKLEAFAAAKEAGLDGVEVSLGKGKDHLPMADAEKQKAVAAEARKYGLAIPSTCLEILHRDGLKGHPDAPKWLAEAIEITRDLGAKAILMPSFGGQALEKREEQKAVAERLKPLAPIAEKAGVVLGLENTISAEDNAWIIDQVGSPAVKVYYDVGNSFPKFDVYREILWLGGARVCSIHLKDRTPLLGQGKIDFPRFIEAVLKSGYAGWLMLETGVATTVADTFAANANYVRGLLKGMGAS